MRVLLDECVPRKFKASLSGHEVLTVPEVGLAGLSNGELLSAAESLDFQVFLTIKKGIEWQQSMVGRKIGVVVVLLKTNQLLDLLPHNEICLRAIREIRAGEFVKVGV